MDILSTLSLSPELLRVFQSAVGATAEGITIADARQKDMPLIFINKAFSIMTGYQPLEVIGKNCRFLQGKDTNPLAVEKIRLALTAREQVSLNLLNYRKDGTTFINRLSLVPVFDTDHQLTHYVGIQSDITAEVQTQILEKQSQAMRATLETVNNVVLNFMTQLQYYRLQLGNGEFDLKALLKEFDASYEDAKQKLGLLNLIKEYKEVELATDVIGLDLNPDPKPAGRGTENKEVNETNRSNNE